MAAKSARVPGNLHIDKRADSIITASAGGDDDLLDTRRLAAWLKVSEQWLETARHKGYGPRFDRLGPRLIRYRVGRSSAG